jgi:hypothetical protein
MIAVHSSPFNLEVLMNIVLNRGTIQLDDGVTARVERSCGARLVCRDGTAWITIDHDPRDIVLSAGESFVVDSNSPLLVTSLSGSTRLTLSAADPAAAQCNKPRRAQRSVTEALRSPFPDDVLAAAAT